MLRIALSYFLLLLVFCSVSVSGTETDRFLLARSKDGMITVYYDATTYREYFGDPTRQTQINYYIMSNVRQKVEYVFGLEYICSNGTKETFFSDPRSVRPLDGKTTGWLYDIGVCKGSDLVRMKGAIFTRNASPII